MRAFHSLPLADDDGRVGIFSFESSDPDFLNTAHLEMIKVLAGQATVALRNASLYREVPFINVLEPILQRKRQFLALEKQRRWAIAVAAAVALVFLARFLCRCAWMRGGGWAFSQRAGATGNSRGGAAGKRTRRRSGSTGRGAGESRGLALPRRPGWGAGKVQTAISQMNRALANNDGAEAGIQRTQAEYWDAEVGRAHVRMDKTVLRSPIDGVVANPHIEDTVRPQPDSGRYLCGGRQYLARRHRCRH